MLPAPSTTETSTPRSRDALELLGDRVDGVRVGAELEVAHERLARQLHEDPLEGGLVRHAPTWNRAKRRMTTFSPIVARELRAQLLDRLALVLVGVDVLLVRARRPPSTCAACPRRSCRGRSPACRPPAARRRELGVLGLLRDVVLGDVLRRRRGRDVQRHLAGERLEVLVARDEVGVAVDLDEHADLAAGVDVGRDGALGGLAVADLHGLVARRTRRSSTAASMSPSVSCRAFLQSIMPAPVRSRSSLTCAAVIGAH